MPETRPRRLPPPDTTRHSPNPVAGHDVQKRHKLASFITSCALNLWALNQRGRFEPWRRGSAGLRPHQRHWSPLQHSVAGTYRTPVHGPAMAGPPQPQTGCQRGLVALPKILANSTRSGHMTWSKLLTLFHQGQSPAPVLLQFHVPLSTSNRQIKISRRPHLRRSTGDSCVPFDCGAEGVRTPDPTLPVVAHKLDEFSQSNVLF